MDKQLKINMRIIGSRNMKENSTSNNIKTDITCARKDYVIVKILKS
ncbi:TPA: hypothetical protein I9080_003134 [Clostridium perfringens]|uniref:Uncharacterized protein n=1 Tax=Clostridium perfringens TaxID=1502 RepID=A0A8H9R042_CLOPF|nr:hypothetical protein [Clostridium perfringens]